MLTKEQVNTARNPSTGEETAIPSLTYTLNCRYDAAQPHAVSFDGNRAYTYDQNGNMTEYVSSDGKEWRKLFWDDENRLIRTQDNAGTVEYAYDEGGLRSRKKSALGETLYVNPQYSVRNGEVYSKHVFAGNARLATTMVKRKGSAATELGVYYYHGDHLGSSNVITDRSGQFHEHLEYFPYGETWVHEKAAGSSEYMAHLFTGKEKDTETGLYSYEHRYYDPRLGKWLSVDPILNSYIDSQRGLGGIFNSINLNLYHYASNNPIRFIDPDGKETAVAIDSKSLKTLNNYKIYNAYVYENTKAGSLKYKAKEFLRTIGIDVSDRKFEVARDTRGKNLRSDTHANWYYDTNKEMPTGIHEARRITHPTKGNVTRIGDVFDASGLDNRIANPHRPGEFRTWFNFDPYSPAGLDGCIGVVGPNNDYFGGNFQKLDQFLTEQIPDLLKPDEKVWIDIQNRH